MEQTVLFSYQDDTLYMHHTRTPRPDRNHFSFRSHSHNMYEIYYFLSGRADFAVEGNVHSLKKGTLVLTARGQTHNILIQDAAAPYERIAILFSQKALPPGFPAVLDALGNGVNAFFLADREQTWLEESFRLVENAPGSAAPAVVIQAVVATVFAKIAALVEFQPPPAPAGDALVRDIIRFIHQNLTTDWHLDTLEKALFRSKVYLNRRFQRVMGCSIWEYTLRKRIFSAQQTLYLSQSIADAYQSSGFQDYSVFYRRYKKYIGLSPSEDLKNLTAGDVRGPEGEPSKTVACRGK